jgi:hypothetical protein
MRLPKARMPGAVRAAARACACPRTPARGDGCPAGSCASNSEGLRASLDDSRFGKACIRKLGRASVYGFTKLDTDGAD